jgi:hypothetical protein
MNKYHCVPWVTIFCSIPTNNSLVVQRNGLDSALIDIFRESLFNTMQCGKTFQILSHRDQTGTLSPIYLAL